MNKAIYLLALLFIIPAGLKAQIDWNKTIDNTRKQVDEVTSKVGGKKSLSNDEIIQGLKEALTVGSKNSSDIASRVDGYYKNPNIKIPFPQEAQKVETKLRQIGMNKQVDEFVVTLNRAAEDAAKQAAPVFGAAVRNMTIGDGLKILNGSNDAATVYLKNTTTAELTNKFLPIIRQSLEKVQVTKYWNPLITTYNRIPMVEKQNPNLENYVTQKALEGLFFLVSQEELKIRQDPAARITDILKKVFGKH